MKKNYGVIILSIFCFLHSFSQQNTEVYLAQLNQAHNTMPIDSVINISNNLGYDNQPSFYSNDKILFSSTRNQQTDIALYDINDKSTVWISNTPNGSEYSPLKIPGENAISAIRLDEDGLQRLYRYDLKTGESKIILPDLKVGYHLWYSNTIIVSTVLVENGMDLVVSNLSEHTNHTIQKNVGRSLHKIPNSDLISYISKEGNKNTIISLHPPTRVTKELATLLNQSEDVCWVNDGSIISANDNTLITINPTSDDEWKPLFVFKEQMIHDISRLAISPNGKYITFVSKETPDLIVQKQVETFNARNLEAFVACYSEDVVVKNFPMDTLYISRKKMLDNYREFYKKTPSIEVKVASRIMIGSTVIDHEVVTIDEKQNHQVAIYEIDGLIKSMTFIRDQKTSTNPEPIVQNQLDAYNARNIDAFMATLGKNVSLYNFPNSLRVNGREATRKYYSDFFAANKDLNSQLKNRIIIGNMVIDEEFITAKGTTYSVVAIYEVKNGKIAKVTLLR